MAGVSAFVGVTGRGHPVDRGVVPATAAAVGSTAPITPATNSVAQPTEAAQQTGSLPTGIDVPQLAVRASTVPVSVTADGALVVPDDVHTVGWWVGGALPGSATGTVVLDGHVDSAVSGPGALFDLRDLHVGATVVVTGDPRDVSYRITGLREYDKGDLPAASLFAQTGSARLVLITCGGPFDAATRHYRDNVVAFGVPIAS